LSVNGGKFELGFWSRNSLFSCAGLLATFFGESALKTLCFGSVMGVQSPQKLVLAFQSGKSIQAFTARRSPVEDG
jgi:hypothetical protein